MQDRNITNLPTDIFIHLIFPLLSTKDLLTLQRTNLFFKNKVTIDMLRKKRITQVIKENYASTLLLTAGGDVWAFGHNHAGKFGIPKSPCLFEPKKILTAVASIVSAFGTIYFIMQDKRLMISGNHNFDDSSPSPYYLPEIGNVAAVLPDISKLGLLILHEDGTVTRVIRNWGHNLSANLLPHKKKLNVNNVKQLEFIDEFGYLFLHLDGTVSLMKKNDKDYDPPEKITDVKNIRKIAGKFLLSNSGDVYELKATDFILIPSLGNIINIVTYSSIRTFFITSTGSVYSYALFNLNGQLGLGHTNGTNIPELIPGLTNVVDIISCSTTTLFLIKDGSVLTCGSNVYYEPGTNEPPRHLKPTPVTELQNIVSLNTVSNYIDYIGHRSHQVFVDAEGAVFVQGSNSHGQIGLGTQSSSKKIIPHPFFQNRTKEINQRLEKINDSSNKLPKSSALNTA